MSAGKCEDCGRIFDDLPDDVSEDIKSCMNKIKLCGTCCTNKLLEAENKRLRELISDELGWDDEEIHKACYRYFPTGDVTK